MTSLDYTTHGAQASPRLRRLIGSATALLAVAVAVLAGPGAALAAPTAVSTSSPSLVSDGTILGLPAVTAASGSLTQTYFVCPTVGLNNHAGNWVIGYHGGYYVIVPKQGDGSKVFVNIPTHVFYRAQIPAGWGLYHSLPDYPNFVGTGMLLQEGIDHWFNDPAGWQEGDMASVVANADGTYTATDQQVGTSVTVAAIPLASGSVW